MAKQFLNSIEAVRTSYPNYLPTSGSKQKTFKGHTYNRVGTCDLSHSTGWKVGRVFKAIGMSALSIFLWPSKYFRKDLVKIWKEAASGKEKLSLYVFFNKAKHEALQAVRKDGDKFKDLPPELKNDEEILLAALESDKGSPIQYCSKELQDIENIALMVVRRNPQDYNYLSAKMRKNKAVALAALEKENVYKILDATVQKEKDVALAALKMDPAYYAHLSYELQNDEELLREALKGSAEAIKHAPKKLKESEECALLAVRKDPAIFAQLDEKMRGSEKVLLAALESNKGSPIQHTSCELQNKENIALIVVGRNPQDYKYLSENMQKNRTVVLAALEKGNIYKNLDINLQKDQEIAFAALKIAPDYYEHLCPVMHDNEELLRLALKTSGKAILHASKRLQAIEEFAISAVSKNPEVYEHLKDLHDNENVLKEALKRSGEPIKHSFRDLQEKYGLEAVEKHADAYEHLPLEMRDKKKLLIAALKHSKGSPIQYASSRLKNKESVAVLVVRRNPLDYKYLSDELQNNKDFAIASLNSSHAVEALTNLSKKEDNHLARKEILRFAKKNLKETFSSFPNQIQKHPEVLAAYKVLKKKVSKKVIALAELNHSALAILTLLNDSAKLSYLPIAKVALESTFKSLSSKLQSSQKVLETYNALKKQLEDLEKKNASVQSRSTILITPPPVQTFTTYVPSAQTYTVPVPIIERTVLSPPVHSRGFEQPLVLGTQTVNRRPVGPQAFSRVAGQRF